MQSCVSINFSFYEYSEYMKKTHFCFEVVLKMPNFIEIKNETKEAWIHE